ncbi:MAG: hypothetical protein JST00_23445 [Deltaproteobacteria bacterium]|nr:hypothetical protein [Deltaproteobacteria bacterium]
MIPFVAALVAFACAAASARRVWFAANATGLDPEDVERAIARSPDAREAVAKLRALVTTEPSLEWERDLFQALDAPGRARAALVNEQLTELDYRIQRWSRVPRVCASIATSFAFLLASLVLRRGLVDAGELPSDVVELVARGLVADAFTVASMGMIGTVFCIVAQSEAKKIAKRKMAAADRMVERLEAVAAHERAAAEAAAQAQAGAEAPTEPAAQAD